MNQPSESPHPSSSPTPSPTVTSSNAGSEAQLMQNSSPSMARKLLHIRANLLSYTRFSWFKASGNEPQPPESTVRTLESCPKGYPNLAAFLDSDENFMLYRRFGFLQSRILLHKQDELRALEEKLDLLDKVDSDNSKTKKLLGSRDLDDKSKGQEKHFWRRSKLSSKNMVGLKLAVTWFFTNPTLHVAELLKIAQTLIAYSKPASRDYNSVKYYFDEEAPLCEDECYIYHKEDIITLKPGRENAWLDGMIEKLLQKCTCVPIRYLFCSTETRAKSNGPTVYYTKSRIETLVTLIITLIILILMVIPVYVLWHLSMINEGSSNATITIGVLLVFTLMFSGVLSFFTRAKRHEIFAAAATYCAVLVVFISNVGQSAAAFKH